MNTNELYELFMKKKECAFVAVFGSVLQINCANAAISMLSKQGMELQGYVFRVVTNTIAQKTYDSNFVKQSEGIEYVDDVESFEYSKSKERLDVFKCACIERRKEDTLYFISADLIHPLYYSLVKAYGNYKRIIYVEVDDGLESYAPRYKNRLLMYKIKHQRQNVIGLNNFIREMAKVFSIQSLLRILKAKNNYIDDRLLDLNNGVKRNENIATFFLDSLYENYNASCNDINIDLNNKILIVGDWTTPIELIAKCIDDLMELGYKVVYKPHPRELNKDRLMKIKCEIMDMSDTALEVFLVDENNRPICLIGEYSSVLMYSNIYFGVKSISCKSIREFSGDNLDRKYIKMYEKIFDKVIFFPHNEDDLIECIKEL